MYAMNYCLGVFFAVCLTQKTADAAWTVEIPLKPYRHAEKWNEVSFATVATTKLAAKPDFECVSGNAALL